MSPSAPSDAQCADLLIRLAVALEQGRGPELPASDPLMAACLRRAATALDPAVARPMTAPEPPPAPRPASSPGRATLFADGGSRGNPGPAGAGAVVLDADGVQLATVSRYLGHATNNVAEYQALILGLEAAAGLGVERLEVRLDSELLVKQLNGQYQVKAPHLRPLFLKARQLLQRFAGAHIMHVRREANQIADGLANQAMDRRSN